MRHQWPCSDFLNLVHLLSPPPFSIFSFTFAPCDPLRTSCILGLLRAKWFKKQKTNNKLVQAQANIAAWTSNEFPRSFFVLFLLYVTLRFRPNFYGYAVAAKCAFSVSLRLMSYKWLIHRRFQRTHNISFLLLRSALGIRFEDLCLPVHIHLRETLSYIIHSSSLIMLYLKNGHLVWYIRHYSCFLKTEITYDPV